MRRSDDWLLWTLAALLAAGAIVSAPKIISAIRGIRNNNPGNIERTGTVWQGMAADQSGDPRFIVFTDAVYGIRAMARILRNYVSQGYNTVRKIVSRWAPASENDTLSYIASVVNRTGIDPDRVLSATDLYYELPGLLAAIIQHENGIQPYSAATIARGIELERTT